MRNEKPNRKINPNRKGKRGEYAVRDLLRQFGFEAERTPLSGAIPGWREDITSDSFPFSIEVKNRQTWQPLEWYKSTHEKCPKPAMVVLTKNNEGLYAFVDLVDLLTILTGKVVQPIRKVQPRKKVTLDELPDLPFSKKKQLGY